MRDLEFMAQLLALEEPWRVHQVALTPKGKQLDVSLEHRRGASFACPECGQPRPIYDHLPPRGWRHLDHGEFLTWLHARVPRISCPKHGVRQVQVPWALAGARFTLPFEGHAIDTLLEADVLGASRLLNLSWYESWHLMERAVARGLKAKKQRVLPLLGVDEKSFAKRHRYVTLVCDLKKATVQYIADDRKKTSLDAYYESLTKKQLAGIQAVAMDMWDPFIASTVEQLPLGRDKIVFDRYHVMTHMNKAVDQVRRGEHRLLQEQGDDTLKGTKYLWLFAEENLPEKWEQEFARLRGLHLRTGRAWAIKEALRHLWDYQRKGWALRYWQHWYYWATHSRLPPVVKAAKTIHAHLDNVLTYFDHRITNATSEGLNSKIRTVKKTPVVSATVHAVDLRRSCQVQLDLPDHLVEPIDDRQVRCRALLHADIAETLGDVHLDAVGRAFPASTADSCRTRRCRPGRERTGASTWRAGQCRSRINAVLGRISSWSPSKRKYALAW